MEISNIFSKLPSDMKYIICLYYGRIKYRKGEFINIISKDDERYNILTNLKRPRSVKYAEIFDCKEKTDFEYCVYFNENYRLRVWSITSNNVKYLFEVHSHNYNPDSIYYRF